MKIHAESRVAHPRAAVYAAYRDRLPAIAAYIPDIKEIRVVSREVTAQGLALHNRWVADREIPSMLSRFVRPEMLCWDDLARWDDAAHCCTWRLSIPAFPDQVQCTGKNTFIEDGAHTRVVLTGDLEISGKIPGVPSMLARTLAPQVEKFIVHLITPNLEQVNHSLGRFLDAQG